MPVRIRLARFGRRNVPFYRIFVADSRSPRDGKHLEVIGHYDPIPARDGTKHIGLNFERLRYWLGVGAQPTDVVARLLGQAGVMPMAPRPARTRTADVPVVPPPARGFAASAAPQK